MCVCMKGIKGGYSEIFTLDNITGNINNAAVCRSSPRLLDVMRFSSLCIRKTKRCVYLILQEHGRNGKVKFLPFYEAV